MKLKGLLAILLVIFLGGCVQSQLYCLNAEDEEFIDIIYSDAGIVSYAVGGETLSQEEVDELNEMIEMEFDSVDDYMEFLDDSVMALGGYCEFSNNS